MCSRSMIADLDGGGFRTPVDIGEEAWVQSAKVKLPEWHKVGQPKAGEAPAPAKKEPVGATAD